MMIMMAKRIPMHMILKNTCKEILNKINIELYSSVGAKTHGHNDDEEDGNDENPLN